MNTSITRIRQQVDELYRAESRCVFAALIRLLGDFDLAEEAMHDAFALYDVLAQVEPSPIVRLNRAVAVAMRDGPLAGLALIDDLLAQGELTDYHLAHAARADLSRRLGNMAEAKVSYQRALAIARQEPERRFLEKRIIVSVERSNPLNES
jgi:RNA polymerase sigma-70 factor (ECF subfamily)